MGRKHSRGESGSRMVYCESKTGNPIGGDKKPGDLDDQILMVSNSYLRSRF